MKYFIKRDVCADFGAFEIYDETGIEKYLAEFSKSKRSRKIPYRMLTIRLLQCKREYFRVRKVMNSMCIRRQMNCYQYLLRFV